MLALVLLAPAILAAAGNSPPSKYVNVGSVPPAWQIALLKHGDRLQSPGKDRLTLTGTVTRKNSTPVPFQIVNELPNMVRYQEGSGPNATTIVFDGANYATALGGVQKQDTDLVETLAYDSPERFFYGPGSRLPMRKLGSRFRTDGQNGNTYAGPVYDVFQVLDSVQQAGKVKQQAKYYHVNSDTHLVEGVYYQDADSPSTKVAVILGNWTTVSKNRVPQVIRRLENGVEVLRLTVTSATFGPAVADTAFIKP